MCEDVGSMSTERFVSAWGAIEDTQAQVETMKCRSALIMARKDHLARADRASRRRRRFLG